MQSGLIRAKSDWPTRRTEYATLQRLAAQECRDQGRRWRPRGRRSNAPSSRSSHSSGGDLAWYTQPDKSAAEARLQEAQSGAAAASQRLASAQIHSPMNGILYRLEAKPGGYLNPGDLVAEVGRLNQLRVRVYVDEPELGRVEKGMPVTITWDAMPGRRVEGLRREVCRCRWCRSGRGRLAR